MPGGKTVAAFLETFLTEQKGAPRVLAMTRRSRQNAASPQASPRSGSKARPQARSRAASRASCPSPPAADSFLRRFGIQISLLRRHLGWTQRQLASRLGIPSSSLSRYERAFCEPGLTFLVRLSRVSGLSL